MLSNTKKTLSRKTTVPPHDYKLSAFFIKIGLITGRASEVNRDGLKSRVVGLGLGD